MAGVGIITGAAGGIGRACAAHMLRDGWQVVMADLDHDAAEVARREAGADLAVAVDVADPHSAAHLMAVTVAELGTVDGLVAAAGIFQSTPLDDIEVAEWDAVQHVNVRGAFVTAQAALRQMRARGGGSIVLLGSVAGQVGGIQSGAGYATSKAAVIGMTKALARHAGPHGVRVNCVNPGYIESGMSLGMAEADRERTIAATPLGRPGTAAEVAEAVTWLLGDASSFVTGAHVDVNGGLLMD